MHENRVLEKSLNKVTVWKLSFQRNIVTERPVIETGSFSRIIFHLCLRKSGSEASNWLVGQGPHRTTQPKDF